MTDPELAAVYARHEGVNGVMLASSTCWEVVCAWCGAVARAKGNGMEATAELYDLGWRGTPNGSPVNRYAGTCPDCDVL